MPIASWSPTGASNLAGALFGAMPAGGGTSQTAVVRAAGGRTQTASLVTAGAALATMLFLAPLLGLMPNATLAMIVIVYSVGLIQPAEFIAIRKVRTMEFRWAVAAALGVLLFGTLQGILVAIIVSLISLSSQATRPTVHVIGRKRGADVLRPLSPEHPDDETFEGLLIVRPEGRLFFANAQSVADQVKALTAAAQAARAGAGPEPGARHRVFGAADAHGVREAGDGTGRRPLAGGTQSRRAPGRAPRRFRRSSWAASACCSTREWRSNATRRSRPPETRRLTAA